MNATTKFFDAKRASVTLVCMTLMLSACTTSNTDISTPKSYIITQIKVTETKQAFTPSDFQKPASLTSPLTIISPEKVIAGKQFGPPTDTKFGNVLHHYAAAYNRSQTSPQAQYELNVRYYEQFGRTSAGGVASDVGNAAAGVVLNSAANTLTGGLAGNIYGSKRKTGVNYISAVVTVVDPGTGQKILTQSASYEKTYLGGKNEKIERTLYEGVTKKIMAIAFKKSSSQIDTSMKNSNVLLPSITPLSSHQ